ncbi:hypothetical protein [Oligoflexus tunisiensis]|nr:hypothetical protein [Oligoflexus tunisiensis]
MDESILRTPNARFINGVPTVGSMSPRFASCAATQSGAGLALRIRLG